jgi:lipopolysaccharide export system protein LptA
VALGLLAPWPAAAQQAANCRFAEGTANVQSNTVPGVGRVSYVSRPRIACDDGVRIQADSAVVYSEQAMSHLIGHVRYRDGTRELRADDARYFSRVARLQANGHLLVRDFEQGSTIENGELVYLRKTAFRAQEQMTVTRGRDRVRPKALLHMRPGEDTVTVDSAQAAPSPSEPDTVPYQVEADRLFLQGDRYFSAGGDVVIERDSLVARSDSAEYDQVAALMLLEGSARVDDPTYNLSGRRIEMAVPGGHMRSVRAVHEATLLGDDLEMRAPSIQIFLTEGAMDRLVAIRLAAVDSAPPTPAGGVPPPPVDSLDLARPVAEAEDFVLTADSVEVRTPGQVLDRIFAAGTARGESSARDSLNVPDLPDIARKDWLEGDTVIATFVRADPAPAQPTDTARGEYRLERLTALGGAKSLYRLLPSDSTAHPGVDRPAVHYVTGSMIVIVMNEGEVDRMEVVGPTEGWHLEPTTRGVLPDSLTPPDTSAVGPDTTRIGPDTTRIGPDTASAASPAARRPDTVGHDPSEGRGRDGGPGRDRALPAGIWTAARMDRRWRRR